MNRQTRNASAAFLAGFLVSIFISGCSVPNLEAPECTAARGVAREFYSSHFGSEMRFSPEGLKQRERFLSRAFADSVRSSAPDIDPFTTGTSDIPKAFRIGGCEVRDPQSTKIEVVLFWRDDTRSEERKINVDAVKIDGGWVLDKIQY